jgi:hypothetical protein
MPTEMDVKLQLYNASQSQGAVPNIVLRFNPNCAFQPVVGGPTAAVPGFSHWALFYGFYRVVAYEYEITITNNEAFAINCYLLNLNNDPTTTGTASLSTNALSQHKVIAPKGGMDKAIFKKRLKISDIAGTTAVEFDDTYRALINASPADLFWLGVGIASVSGVNLTNGATITTYLTMYTRFYDRLDQ